MATETGTPDPAALLDGVLAACREAAAAILAVYERDFAVETKDDDSPLTEADMASHRIIKRHLLALTPDIPLLSEESTRQAWHDRRDWRALWIVDPLDGTREFVKRNGEFTINVALAVDHRPVLGVIGIPVHGILYAGIPGQGAWRIRDDERTPVSTRVPATDPPVVLGSRSHSNPRMAAYLEALGEHELMARGSALKFCSVAAGEADFYPRLGPTSEWDTAAGDAIVEAAGGRVVNAVTGEVLTYNARETLLNPEFLVSGDPGRAWPAPPPPPAGSG